MMGSAQLTRILSTVAGLCRLGFLDSVLSRPFLRGFISAIGVVIFVDQLIPEMGLDTAAAHSTSAAHGSSLDKIMFLFRHSSEASKITCAVAFGAFAIVMVLREIKKLLQPRAPWVAYIPDRFLVVVLSAVLTWHATSCWTQNAARRCPLAWTRPLLRYIHSETSVHDGFSSLLLIASPTCMHSPENSNFAYGRFPIGYLQLREYVGPDICWHKCYLRRIQVRRRVHDILKFTSHNTSSIVHVRLR